MSFGCRLKLLREKRGLLQEDLALLAEVTPVTLSRYERGERTPTVATAEKLAAALGVHVSAFFDDNAASDGFLTENQDFVFVPIVSINNAKLRQNGAAELTHSGFYPVHRKDFDSIPSSSMKVCVIEGDSMSPKYINGDYALCETPDGTGDFSLSDGDIVAAVFDNKFYIRGYFRNFDGTIDLRPVSPCFMPIHTSADDRRFRLFGKIIRIYRTIRDTGFYG
ncbi:MAG: LexA family transcriptional regulator [Synergistaceae bacterium]|nr:LexA family transcriptional regulator [Candidatus Equadaptatus faecalis]